MGETLFTACMAAYDRKKNPHELFGVVCVDMNVVIAPQDLRSKPDMKDMYAQMTTVSHACSTFSHDLSALQKLRRAANPDAVCNDEDFAIEFVDESMGAGTDPS